MYAEAKLQWPCCRIMVIAFLLFSVVDAEVKCPVLGKDKGGILQISLDDDWAGSSPNRPGLTFKTDAPFTIHTALMKEGKIGDPYFRYNDKNYRWISTYNWLINKQFNAPPQLFIYQRINLVFKGIDTIGDVYLNNAKIGTTNNKFVPLRINVTNFLKQGINIISVWLKSPIDYAKQESISFRNKYNYSVLPNCYPEVLHGECHSNFIRKEPCSFGWDFGPSIPTQGLSDKVYLEAFSVAKLRDIIVNTVRSADLNGPENWVLCVNASIDSIATNVTIFIQYEMMELGVTKTEKKLLHKDINNVTCCMKMGQEVKPWWPNGYGDQTLYTLKVALLDVRFQELDAKALKIGFRTVELIQQPILGSKGLSFYFKINSLPIFLKGSNWIPADALRDRVTNDVIDDYLKSAIDANMNVLRVWGGGGYEIEHFYEACDRLGLLIWHDFMFACAMYPADQRFLGNINAEVTHQVRRLQYHPSIIIWSANNENEAALRENWYGTDVDFHQYKSDYITLYVDTMKSIVAANDVTRPFIVSSPSNAAESEAEGWIAKNPRSPYYGDVHVYDYVNNCWDVDIFPKPRLASEYGYQSYPSLQSLVNVTNEEDLKWNSSLMFYRQHHADGNKQIEDLIKQNFHLPATNDPKMHFEHMVYMSQIVHALCITFETEQYRRLMGRLEPPKNSNSKSLNTMRSSHKGIETGNDVRAKLAKSGEVDIKSNGRKEFVSKYLEKEGIGPGLVPGLTREVFKKKIKHVSHFEDVDKDTRDSDRVAGVTEQNSESDLQGYTMGAMYWQLNDIWQAPSWSSVEYGGRWKMLHYYAKKFFAPISISAYVRKEKLEIFIVSDLLQVTKDVILNLTKYNWANFNKAEMTSYAQDIPAQSSVHIASVYINDACADISSCFILLQLIVPEKPDLNMFRPVFLAPFSKIKGLGDPKLHIEKEMVKFGENIVQMTIKASKPAAFVWLSTETSGRFSDNGFIMYEEARILNFTAKGLLDEKVFVQTLKVVSLYEMYN